MKKCKYEKYYDNNLHYAAIGTLFDEYLKKEVPCMKCKEKEKFGKMFNVFCSDDCSFYHRQICGKCKEEEDSSEM